MRRRVAIKLGGLIAGGVMMFAFMAAPASANSTWTGNWNNGNWNQGWNQSWNWNWNWQHHGHWVVKCWVVGQPNWWWQNWDSSWGWSQNWSWWQNQQRVICVGPFWVWDN